MTDPAPERATPDELAKLYLRARDVPCPGCGYNRRDGMAANCPECSAVIELAPHSETTPPVPPKLVVVSNVCMLTFCIPWLTLSIGYTAWGQFYKNITRLFGVQHRSNLILDWADYLQLLEVSGIACAAWFCVSALWAARRDQVAAARRTARATIALAIGLQPFAWWNVYTLLF